MTNAAVPVPVPVGGAPVVGTPAPAPAAPAPAPAAPAAPAGDDLSALSDTQLADLAGRITAAQANRPPSLAQALTALQQNLSGAHTEKQEAVGARKEATTAADEARANADKLEKSITDMSRQLRRTQLMEAATAANFSNPAVVADHLANVDGEIAKLVTDLAGSGAFAMKTPAPSAAIGGQGSQPVVEMDPGMAALVAEINAAHGR